MITTIGFAHRTTRLDRLEFRTPGGCLKVYYGDDGDDYVYTVPCGIQERSRDPLGFVQEHTGPCGP